MKLDVAKAWTDGKFQHERQLTACRFSPCGKYLAAAGLDVDLQRWNLETGERTALSGHPSWIGDLAFHPDQRRLYSVDYHGGLLCWDHAQDNPQPLWRKSDAHVGWARKVAVSPDGKFLATGGSDRAARLWTPDGKLVAELTGHEGYVFSLLFHPDGKSLVSGDQLGVVRQWEIPSGKLMRQIDATVLHTRKDNFLAHVGGARSLAFNASGELLACGGMTNAKSNSFCPGEPLVVVFDFKSGKETTRLKPSQKADGPINSLRFLSDGTLAGVGEGASGASLAFWKLDQATPIHSVKRASGYDLDVHPDGLRLAASRFETNGRGGNGRHSEPENYVSNDGVVDVFRLHEKPAP
ncbi:MAG: WD40 repeat domain-containing protein [Planctomycetales bacterium]